MNAETNATQTREDNLQHIFCQFAKLVRDMRQKQMDAENYNGSDRHEKKRVANRRVDDALVQMGIDNDTNLDEAVIMFRKMKAVNQK